MENNPEINKDSQEASNSIQPHSIPFYEAFKVWVNIALLSFGGPAGQIAIMHKILVEEKRWIGEERFLHALNFCMLLPGPEAQQLATYIGWLLHKTKGGLMAGLLFILPGFIAILLMSYAYVFFGNIPQFEGLLLGLKASVLAIVFQAIIRISSRSLKTKVATIYASVSYTHLDVYKRQCSYNCLQHNARNTVLAGYRAPWHLHLPYLSTTTTFSSSITHSPLLSLHFIIAFITISSGISAIDIRSHPDIPRLL